MSIAFVYEDHEASALGVLLKQSYNSANLYFSRSNTRLFKAIKQIYERYDEIVVFYDLVPDNAVLLPNLSLLQSRLVTEDMYRKVHIVPVICSEYVYLCSLKQYQNVRVLGLSPEQAAQYGKSAEKYFKKLISAVEIGSYGEFEGEFFYISYPAYTLADDAHRALLEKLGVSVRKFDYDEIAQRVIDQYTQFYAIYNMDFAQTCRAAGVCLFRAIQIIET